LDRRLEDEKTESKSIDTTQTDSRETSGQNHDYNNNRQTNGDNGASDDCQPSNQRQSACNVIHKRYFYRPVVERLCRCPGGDECPWEWNEPPHYGDKKKNRRKHRKDSKTMMIGSRTQIKVIVITNSPPTFKTPRIRQFSAIYSIFTFNIVLQYRY